MEAVTRTKVWCCCVQCRKAGKQMNPRVKEFGHCACCQKVGKESSVDKQGCGVLENVILSKVLRLTVKESWCSSHRLLHARTWLQQACSLVGYKAQSGWSQGGAAVTPGMQNVPFRVLIPPCSAPTHELWYCLPCLRNSSAVEKKVRVTKNINDWK